MYLQRKERGGRSPSILLTKKSPRRVLTWPHKFTERNHWILPIQGLRTGREQHVPESSNHSLYLVKLLSSIFILRETLAGISTHNTQHTYAPTHTHRPTHHHSPPLPSLSLPHAHAHANAHAHARVYVHARVFVYVCICICRCVCTCVCTCVCFCVRMCLCL